MDIRQQVLAAFQVEHKEQVASLRSILAALRDQETGPVDPRRWDEAFRMAHTLKGGARVCDLRDVEALGHRMESLFSHVREGELPFDADVAKTVSRALDEIEDCMAALTSGVAAHSITQTLEDIERLLAGAKTAPAFLPLPPSGLSAAPVAESPLSAPPAPPAPSVQTIDTPAPDKDHSPALPPINEIESVRVQTQHLDTLTRSVDAFIELNTEHQRLIGEFTRLADQLRELQRQCDAASSKVAPLLRRQSEAPELGGVERHIDAITQGVRRLGRQLRSARASHKRIAWAVRTTGDEARASAQRLRMISADNVLQGLAPMVRSLARDEGKEIEFHAVGLHVHADRSVLAVVREAVLHALRNAIVHGIETPDERLARNKPREGKITLTLQNRGDHLHVLVEDDGRGIDLTQVRRAAQRRGIRTDDDHADEPSTDDAILRLLFRPGFTTCDTVTELAGRGMGLSIVHENIARLHGATRLTPRLNTPGAALEIRVPLVISSERLLLVSCAEQTFALPTRAVSAIVRVPTDQIQRVGNYRVAMIDGSPVRLASFLQCEGEKSSYANNGALQIAVLRGDEGARPVGIVVDRLIAEREAVMRNLTGPAASVPYFCGGIVLEESEVALVIDPAAVLASLSARTELAPHTSASPRRKPPTVKAARVLVVDDSFTTRTLEKSILETNGYEVHIAVDGLEALRFLRHESVDLVIADVQMPRMDGLSLLREIRGDPKTAKLPVILVTSLDRPEDHQRSVDLKASAYIVKQRFDHQDLLTTIRKFV